MPRQYQRMEQVNKFFRREATCSMCGKQMRERKIIVGIIDPEKASDEKHTWTCPTVSVSQATNGHDNFLIKWVLWR